MPSPCSNPVERLSLTENLNKLFAKEMKGLRRVSRTAALIAAMMNARGWAGPDLTVALPQGETRLTEIGLYRVGWQSYGGDSHWMPLAWSGESDPVTGIVYHTRADYLGREALLMHSPWRVPGGRTWVDYQLALPRHPPLTLSFGIAMDPNSMVPGKSDGVTFSCFLSDDTGEHELLRRHWDQGTWEDHTFDLSADAGKTVTIRLQVEPGPDNNSSWDFSYFGNPQITVGRGNSNRGKLVENRLAGTAWKATASADMRALSNASGRGVAPSNLLDCHNSLLAEGGDWRFTYQGDDCRISYLYHPTGGTLGDFTVQIDDGPPFQPATGGGVGSPLLLDSGRLVSATRRGEELVAVWEYTADGKPVRVDWTYQILGKALLVSARCHAPVVESFSLGQAAAALRKPLDIPYLAGRAEFLTAQGVFICRYLDWTKSNSSRCPQGGAVYEATTGGTRNPLFESGYIAVSPELAEVLPNIPNPPSPFVARLAPRIMLDVWGHHDRSYAGDTEVLRELKDSGVDHLAIIQHDWQHFGYDVKLPDHLPANPAYGSEDDLREYGRTATACGYLWALHENYIDIYPDAPSYDPAARVLNADGTPSPAWLNEGTGVQSFGLKCNRALDFARQVSPVAHQRYGTTAAYLDVHTCVPPWHQLDHDASQPSAAIARFKVERDGGLFQFERDSHGGPMFGEGNHHFYWAGRCDGVEAQVQGGEDHVPFLDFDLLKIHPQMVNHGMGYYERWFRAGQRARWGIDVGSVAQLDKYRAMEIAYGHAGFIGNALTSDVQAIIREHHLMYPVQRLYGIAKPVEIRYQLGERLVPGGLALVAGDTSRQRIRYDNGLTVWVNWNPQPWTLTNLPDRPAAEVVELPQWGFLALGADTMVATRLHDGKFADQTDCPEFFFADARTWFDPSQRRARWNIEPRLREFTHLGGNRVRVSYEWRVGESPGGDYQCFVHGTHPDAPRADHIAFQQDHPLPKPTTAWQAGEVIVDGPYEFDIPVDRDWYDLVIGLHQGPRLRLTGPSDGGDRVIIARLMLDRMDGKIRTIRSEAAPPEASPAVTPAADFTAHTNPPGTWIDFGKVATDGALMIRREAGQLTVFPYPRGREFRASLELKALAPGGDAARARVRAVAAGTGADLGPVPITIAQGRLMLQFGMAKAGRYVITWR
ncbi:MAG: hypothetical protein K9N23_10970 [Akkermansiaceae bacterium]|nr:hypothetical protein [Akkermansiaceae bacterium]